MCIQRSVLNHYIFRHTDTERSKIPYGFNAACHHRIRNFLRNLNRYCQHTDIDVICLHFLFKIIGMIDWNAIQCCPYQIGIYIKCCHNLQTEMFKPESRSNAPPKLPTPKRNALCILVNPKKSSSTAISVSISYPTRVRPEILTYDKSFAI